MGLFGFVEGVAFFEVFVSYGGDDHGGDGEGGDFYVGFFCGACCGGVGVEGCGYAFFGVFEDFFEGCYVLDC